MIDLACDWTFNLWGVHGTQIEFILSIVATDGETRINGELKVKE